MLKGSLVALVTPMLSDGSIDYGSLASLVDFHVESGTNAIISVGTTGESATLTADEQIEVVRKTVEFSSGRIPIIAGTGANSTAEALELTERAADCGVQACLLVVPYYNKPPQHGLIAHFSCIAKQVDIPQILYNVPSRTSLDMTNNTVEKLAEFPNIIGIKDATSDIPRVADIKQRCGEQFAVYSGNDDTALSLIKAGGDGCISVTANVAPNKMSKMCDAALKGDMETAEKLNAQLDPLHESLFVEANPIPSKWALHQMGKIADGIRLPLMPLSEVYFDQVRTAMQTAEVI
ncbi:MAG: 4-hydroxy-tetrahydrodipicolinate synthase [Gammaproteobacteria bacterium]|nr:4-hydroxy-tetrahydrodipicolinate synthase [Gammaproteobacteria bacterium]MCY4218942.1 4-hydroxy-tetrahydrodipicolinate synthase [Gammaproteobacteria bacterium]